MLFINLYLMSVVAGGLSILLLAFADRCVGNNMIKDSWDDAKVAAIIMFTPFLNIVSVFVAIWMIGGQVWSNYTKTTDDL